MRKTLAIAMAVLMVSPVSWAQVQSHSRPQNPNEPADGERSQPTAALQVQVMQPVSLEGGVDAASYVVGPGDQFHLVLWGLQELQQDIEVTAEGRLFVPRAGVFEAAGKTLSHLRAGVEAKLHALYPGLQSSLTLSRPRTFLVHVTGAVQHPGTY